MDVKVVAWDFDGVLNRNRVDGRFVWTDNFEEDTGQSLEEFTQDIFGQCFDKILTGREDLRDRVSVWAQKVGFLDGADALLEYWFSKDALHDAHMLQFMDKLEANGIRQVIATNNEARRARYIQVQMGYQSRVEQIFASGFMGTMKPEPEFFDYVRNTLGVAANEILLVDDIASNVEQALRQGWQAIHLTDATRNLLEANLPI